MCISRPADKMKACSLHVMYRFIEQGELGRGGGRVGRMAGAMVQITTAEQRSSPASLGLRL